MPIKLYSIEGMPDHLVGQLSRWRQLMVDSLYIDQLLENDELKELVRTLNALCCENTIIGIHYTHAIRSDIERDGLVISQGNSWRQKFLERHGHLFSEDQKEKIKSIWETYFSGGQQYARDNKIAFNFTYSGFRDGGADRLIKYYGGEQVYMPLTNELDIAAILQSLGEPLVLECALHPDQLHTYTDLPWGKIWLSTYHRSVNPEARQYDQDGHQTQSVPHDAISIFSPDEIAYS